MGKCKHKADAGVNPCTRCTTTCPANGQGCKAWKDWWLSRWALIYEYGKKHIK